MAFRDGPLQDLKVPLVWTGAISAVLVGCLALGLLLTDKRERPDGGTYGAARGEFDEALRPVSGVLAWPLRQLGGLGTEIGGYFDAIGQNRRLRARVRELEHVRDEAQALRNVNTRYEQLLNLKTDPPAPMITARVVTDVRGPFSNARLADAGTDAGVKVGFPVMSDHGAVGRVVGVGRGVSRILLLTDVDSRTPILVDRTGSRAILTGDGGAAPRMEYLRGPSPVKPGDIVMTSGDGGVFPRGMPVGVAALDVRGGWRVRLYAEGQDLDYVRILAVDDFSRLAKSQQADLNAKAAPPLPAADAAQLQAAVAAKAAPAASAFSGVVGGASAKPATAPDAAKPAVAKSAAVGAMGAKAPGTKPATKPSGTKLPGTRPPGTKASVTGPSAAKPAAPKPAATKPVGSQPATSSGGAASAAAKLKTVPKPRPKPKLAPAKDRMAPIPDSPGGR